MNPIEIFAASDVMDQIYNMLANLHWSIQAAMLFVPYLALCWLTRGVDHERLWVAIKQASTFFVYERETGRIEAWKVLSPNDPKGDCDEFPVTAVHIYSGGGLKFLWNISNIFKFRMWPVADPNGIGHWVCVCKHGAFDNHMMRIRPVSEYKELGYKFRFLPMPFPVIWLKLLIGKF